MARKAAVIDEPEVSETISKVEAVRRALEEGADSPDDGIEFIRKSFGIDISKAHFSATKSQLKKKAEATKVTIRRGRPKGSSNHGLSGAVNEGDLIAAMEALKPLVASLGAEKTKRLIDLLG